MNNLFTPLEFQRGPGMKNRFMLAPMTNQQSHDDGVLSDEEFTWLTMRAAGGFGLTMTCAAHVHALGQGFAGQLGVFSDHHLEGLTRLATGIKKHDSIAICQLHHAGMRSPAELIGESPLCPSSDEETGAREMTNQEVKSSVEDFIDAAVRCERAGFHGVELHGAHGYLLCQFLSAEVNRRTDEYGGNLDNRSRILFDIISGIRARCTPDFILGVRLSPERFGLQLGEMAALAQRLMQEGQIDFLDMSLWDVFKDPEDETMQGQSLMSYFTELERHQVKLGVAGNIRTSEDAEKALAAGADWVMLGRAAILHHDFPMRCQTQPDFEPLQLPVSEAHLKDEGLSDKFIGYMKNWPGFVTDDAVDG